MTQRGRHFSLSLAPGLFSLLAGTYLLLSSRWATFGVPTTGVHFGDLKVILFASECAQKESDWWIESLPCTPEMAIYNYPSLWAKGFALLGISADSAAAVTFTFVTLFAISLSTLAYLAIRPSNTWFPLITLSLVGISPPVLLGFERGNIDLVIFTLMIAAIVLLTAGKSRSSAVTLAVATFLKIFPLGSALMFIPLTKRRRSTLITYSLTVAVGLLFLLRDLPTIYARTPALDGASFGSALLPLLAGNQLGLSGQVLIAKLAGALLFGLVMIVIYAIERGGHDVFALRALSRNLSGDSVAVSLVLAGGGSFLVAYLIGPSFDYRLITLIPLIAGLTRLDTRVSRIAAILVLIQIILSYSTFVGAAEYLSDLMLVFIAPCLLVLTVRLIHAPRTHIHSV